VIQALPGRSLPFAFSNLDDRKDTGKREAAARKKSLQTARFPAVFLQKT
jgi:hypothetical protein